MTTTEWLTAVSNFLVALTLIAIWKQLRAANRSNEILAIQHSYEQFFILDRLSIEYPQLQLLTTKPSIYSKIKDYDDISLRERAYIEYVFDLHEFSFVRNKEKHYKYSSEFLTSWLSNPRMIRYWKDERGNFRDDFAEEVDRLVVLIESQ